jgi:hypothetical protein
MSKKLGLMVGIVVAVLLAGSIAVARQNADVAGAWALTLTIPMREGRTVTGTLTFEVDGQDLKGTFEREGGDTSTEVTGKIEGTSINFTMVGMGGRPGGGGGRPPGGAPPGGGRGGGMQFIFAGTVDGDTMSGEFEIGDRGSGDWSAERAG